MCQVFVCKYNCVKTRGVMDLTTVLLLSTASLLLLNRRLRRQRRVLRRYSVRPLNRDRRISGNFFSLFLRMKRLDEDMFFIYTRMNVAMWDQLLELVTPHITKRRTIHTISVEERLCITVRFLAEGCSMQEMAFNFKIGKSTVHAILKEMTVIIWEVLSPIYLKVPTQDDLQKISHGFLNRCNMPNCVGAIDGKHIQIRAPKFTGSDHLNYHKTFSIVLMAACDAYYKLTFVDIGAPGSNHDSTVFSTSDFGAHILNGTIQFPNNRALPNTNCIVPTFVVADQAFPLHKRIMRPYPGRDLEDHKMIFNYRLSRARRVIENTFGILAQRWRVFLKPIVAELDMVENITKAAVVLHNFVQRSEEDINVEDRRYCPTGYVDREDQDGNIIPGQWRQQGGPLQPVGRMGANNSTNQVKRMRETLAAYFVSPSGAIPWQENIILRGAIPQ